VRARTQLNHEEREGTRRKRKAVTLNPLAFVIIQSFRGFNANGRRHAGLRELFAIFCAQTPASNHAAAPPERTVVVVMVASPLLFRIIRAAREEARIIHGDTSATMHNRATLWGDQFEEKTEEFCGHEGSAEMGRRMLCRKPGRAIRVPKLRFGTSSCETLFRGVWRVQETEFQGLRFPNRVWESGVLQSRKATSLLFDFNPAAVPRSSCACVSRPWRPSSQARRTSPSVRCLFCQ